MLTSQARRNDYEPGRAGARLAADQRREQVTVPGHPVQHVAAGEHQVLRPLAPRDLVPGHRRRHGRAARGRAASRARSWSCGRCSGSSRPGPCRGAATWSSATRPRRAARAPGARRCVLAIALAPSELVPDSGASNWSPLPPEVLANTSRPASASSGRSHSATAQHSTMVAGAPGSRSNTSRSGSATWGNPPHRGVQFEPGQVGGPDQRGQIAGDDVPHPVPARGRARRGQPLGAHPVRPVVRARACCRSAGRSPRPGSA